MFQDSHRDLRTKMQQHIQHHCLLAGGGFSLSSGSQSSYYFDCKKATLDGNFLSWMAEYILAEYLPQLPEQPDAIGGLTMGADFMTAALVMHAAERGLRSVQGSIVRKEAKGHGTRAQIENELKQEGKKILVVEDVITSGASILKAYQAFVAADYQPVALLTLIDREEGGVADLRKRLDLPVLSIFTASDFTLDSEKLNSEELDSKKGD